MRLSLLDRSRTRAGEPEGQALRATVERATRAEALGYHRFWVAEHHGVPGIASGSPPVLLAAIGGRTSTIRIGSGGVMLPHHQPFVVAEQFLMLAALYGDRVDLGVGRSLGFTEPVRRALRRDAVGRPDTFADDVAELRSYLDGAAPVTAHPVPPAGARVPVLVLATGRGLEVAAGLGLPVVVGGPLLTSPELGDALDGYRRAFVPVHGGSERPSVVVSLDAYVADTVAEARELALPEVWAMARSRQTGEFGPLEPAASIRTQAWTSQVRSRVDAALDRAVAGPPSVVASALTDLVDRAGADEVLVSTSTYDREALAEMDAALAGVLGVVAPGRA